MSLTQTTLEGDETDQGRVIPDTLRYCVYCEDRVLRSRWGDHEDHHAEREAEMKTEVSDDLSVDVDTPDEPEQVGSWFDVRIHKTVEYAFRVPAWDKHRAVELAKEWSWDATPADAYTVHTETDERKEITTEDVPEDFDVYGSTELWEVFED